MNLQRLGAVSVGHMAIDILNSSVAMILTVLAVPFALTNSQIGLGVMIYTLMGSLSQPYFGWLADRVDGRWLGALGLLWTAAFYYGATFSQSYEMLVLLMAVASLGSGAFHPQGAMNASAAGKQQASTATSIFFLLGQMGLAFGPMITGVLLEDIGMRGPRIMAIASLPFVVWMARGLRKPVEHSHSQATPTEPSRQASSSVRQGDQWLLLTAFAVLVALRATVQQTFYGLLPKYFADLGFMPSDYGFMVGFISVAIALGTMCGGILGDRYNQPKILLWALFASVPFSWLMLDILPFQQSCGVAEQLSLFCSQLWQQHASWLFYVLMFGSGFLIGVPHSILVVMAQRLLPRRQGLASGAILGFTFATGAAGMGLASWIADIVSLSAVVHVITLLPCLAAICTFFMRTRPQQGVDPSIIPSGSAD